MSEVTRIAIPVGLCVAGVLGAIVAACGGSQSGPTGDSMTSPTGDGGSGGASGASSDASTTPPSSGGDGGAPPGMDTKPMMDPPSTIDATVIEPPVEPACVPSRCPASGDRAGCCTPAGTCGTQSANGACEATPPGSATGCGPLDTATVDALCAQVPSSCWEREDEICYDIADLPLASCADTPAAGSCPPPEHLERRGDGSGCQYHVPSTLQADGRCCYKTRGLFCGA